MVLSSEVMMLAFHPIKRARDEDSDCEEERYLKRSRPWSFTGFQKTYPPPAALPLRSSCTPSPRQPVPRLDVVTPVESEHSDENSPASVQHDPIFFSPLPGNMDEDMDMDDDDFDILGSQPPDSPLVPFNLRPAKLNTDLFTTSTCNNAGRLPTPIYPTFNAPRGANGAGYSSGGMAGGIDMENGDVSVSDMAVPVLPPPLPRKQGLAHVEQERSRRMPSPISEDEDLPDTPTALTQSQLSRLTVASHSNTSESMDMEMNAAEKRAAENQEPPGANPAPRGRKRSGAFTGRGRFSMGYRDDCEKCKARTPGHYSHFLS